MATLDDAAKTVRDLGFPVVVAGVLLWFLIMRLDPAIERLNVTIRETMGEFSQAMREQTRVFEQAALVGNENNAMLKQLLGVPPKGSTPPLRHPE